MPGHVELLLILGGIVLIAAGASYAALHAMRPHPAVPAMPDDDTRRFCGYCAARGILASFPTDAALDAHLTQRHGAP